MMFLETAGKRYTEHSHQRDQTETDVQPMKTGEREKARGEKIQTNRDAALKQGPVFQSLSDHENASKQNCRDKPALHFPVVVFALCHFGSPDGETAREQTDAKDG